MSYGVVAIGDSVTFAEHLPREAAWTTHLALIIDEPVLNAGVCGDTTRLGLERFPQTVQERRPHTVILQFGLNDCNQWKTDHGLPRVSTDAYKANLVEMVDRARRFGASTVVVCTPTPVRKEAWYERSRLLYANVARQAAARADAALFDADDVFACRKLGEVMLDEVHLSGYGNQLFAEALGAVLRSRGTWAPTRTPEARSVTPVAAAAAAL